MAEAKRFCWVDPSFGDDDGIIADEIRAARERCERVTGLQLLTATWAMYLDQLPGDLCGTGLAYGSWDWLERYSIVLPRPPLLTVTSVTYVDYAGVTQTWDASLYQVDAKSRPARLYPAWGQIWPLARYQMNAVTITYTAGYGAALAVPAEIKSAIKAHVKYCYDNRDGRDEDFLDNLFARFGHGWRF